MTEAASILAVEDLHELVGGVADLTQVDIVEIRVFLGRSRDRGAAEHRHLAGLVGAGADLVDLRLLDMHARHEHRVGPGEILGGRAGDVLVDETHRP